MPTKKGNFAHLTEAGNAAESKVTGNNDKKENRIGNTKAESPEKEKPKQAKTKSVGVLDHLQRLGDGYVKSGRKPTNVSKKTMDRIRRIKAATGITITLIIDIMTEDFIEKYGADIKKLENEKSKKDF